jgi:hypothetical protein
LDRVASEVGGAIRRLKRSKVRVPTNRLQIGCFLTPLTAGRPPGAHWVPGDANAQADCGNEKDLQMQVFSKAAEGIRTLDLLHGKQNVES